MGVQFIRVKSISRYVCRGSSWSGHASFVILWLRGYQKILPNPGEAGLEVDSEIVGETGEYGFVELDPKDCGRGRYEEEPARVCILVRSTPGWLRIRVDLFR